MIALGVALAVVPAAEAASARKLVREGNEAYQHGKYDEALQSYQQAGEQEPDSARIHFNKGAALYRQGDYSKALDEFEQAVTAGSDAGTASSRPVRNTTSAIACSGKAKSSARLPAALSICSAAAWRPINARCSLIRP